MNKYIIYYRDSNGELYEDRAETLREAQQVKEDLKAKGWIVTRIAEVKSNPPSVNLKIN